MVTSGKNSYALKFPAIDSIDEKLEKAAKITFQQDIEEEDEDDEEFEDDEDNSD